MTEETKRKMAVVVIHGIGEQKPFETMYSFAKGLERSYHARGTKITLKHDLLWFDDRGESCISFQPDTSSGSNYERIDILEYYWSHMTQRKITQTEVTDWIFKVAQGGVKSPLYKKGRPKTTNYDRNETLFTKDGELKRSEYITQIMCISGWIKPFFKLLLAVLPYLRTLKTAFAAMETIPYLGTIKKILDSVASFTKGLFSRVMVDFIGDIALYCTADIKSEYYATRTQILNSAADKVKLLALSGDYDEILLCGHSLGSVIAYDVIDRMNRMMQHDVALRGEEKKFKGIVTFGSPLDKVAFFFDEHIDIKKQPIRYATVSSLHSFRRNVPNPIPVPVPGDSFGQYRTIEVGTTIQPHLSTIPWLNFWTQFDVISGPLDVYEDVENIKLALPKELEFKLSSLSKVKLFITSHNAYWRTDEMYDRIIKDFMG